MRGSRAISDSTGIARALRLALLFIAAALALVPGRALAEGFDVSNVGVRIDNNVYLLNADIRLVFSDEVVDALRNGVAVTVVFETNVLRVKTWRWNEALADIEARYSIEYYALSGQYVLRNLELGISSSYRRLRPLLDDLGRLRDFPIIGTGRVEAGSKYQVRVRARLDIESLPAPLRPLAYLSSLWRLRSDWYEFPLTP
jgi:hypothetical protein